MFNIEAVKATAQEATNKLIAEIKANGFDRDYVAEFKDGVEFKVYIQREKSTVRSLVKVCVIGWIVSLKPVVIK